MTSFFGYNIHSRGVRNKTALIEHIILLKPTWLIVMDDLSLAQQLKVASSESNVIHRNYAATKGDDDVHLRYTPQQWIDAHKADIDAGVWLMTTCEPGWSQNVIDWHISLMKLCIPLKIHLVVGNWSVGTPDPSMIGIARPLFELMAANSDLFVLGLHEYAGAVITSGFVGGAPDGYTQSHDKQYHPDYQKQSSWPLNGEAKILTKWHCGRFQFIVDYCKAVGIKPPRIALTELAFDAISDIGWWMNSLPKTAPYTDISGFKTLQAYWQQVFPQWSHDQAYFKQMEYAANNIYDGTVVEGGCIYCFGHTDVKWEADDIEGHTEFLGYMEQYTKPLQPAYTPSDFVANGIYKLSIVGAYRNVRETPGTATGKFAGQLDNGAVVTALEQRVISTDYWWRIKGEGVEGWVSLDGGNVKFIRQVETPPVIVTPPPATPPPVSGKPAEVSVNARLYAAELKVAQAHFELAQLYKQLDEENRLSNAA